MVCQGSMMSAPQSSIPDRDLARSRKPASTPLSWTTGRTVSNKNKLSTATVHKILRNQAYAGMFDWKGRTYQRSYKPLVTLELWERVQAVLDCRHKKRHRKVRHDFAFSGLIARGHCDCSLVGEIKKCRHVNYHCTGDKGKCP